MLVRFFTDWMERAYWSDFNDHSFLFVKSLQASSLWANNFRQQILLHKLQFGTLIFLWLVFFLCWQTNLALLSALKEHESGVHGEEVCHTQIHASALLDFVLRLQFAQLLWMRWTHGQGKSIVTWLGHIVLLMAATAKKGRPKCAADLSPFVGDVNEWSNSAPVSARWAYTDQQPLAGDWEETHMHFSCSPALSSQYRQAHGTTCTS